MIDTKLTKTMPSTANALSNNVIVRRFKNTNPFLLVLGSGFVILFARELSRRLLIIRGDPNDDDDDQNDDDDSFDWTTNTEDNQSSTTARFPWEPSLQEDEDKKPKYSFRDKSTKGRMASMSTTKRQEQQNNISSDKVTSIKQQQQHELNFLASMTFANGGIRTPNCLCCQ